MKLVHIMLVGTALFSTVIVAQPLNRVELTVRVIQQHSASDSRPFRNVSGFLLRRINEPYQAARCYEPTDQQGRLSCQFVCLNQDETAMINLVPPRALDGYADSGEVQVELRGCTLSKREVVVVYRDAAVALYEAFQGTALQAKFAGLTKGQWQPISFESIQGDISALATTPTGREKLADVRVLADALARSRQFQSETSVSAALRAVSVGSSNILLSKAAEQYVNPAAKTQISVSSSKNDYYKNLDVLESKIQGKPTKTAQDFEVLRGIRDLKEEPAKSQLRDTPFLAGKVK